MKRLTLLFILIIPFIFCGAQDPGQWTARQDFNGGIQIVGGVTVSNVYISAGDTMITIAGKDFVLSDIRLKLYISDTSGMLTPYALLSEAILPEDTTGMLDPYVLASEIAPLAAGHDSIGWYNVISFGADPTGIADARASIQEAINAAATAWGDEPLTYIGDPIDIAAGTVYIPAGEYYIAGPDTLKSYIHINIDKGARFHFDGSYSGSMWVSPTNVPLNKCRVTGGYFYGPTQTWNYATLTSEDNLYPILSCYFEDSYIDFCDTAFILRTWDDGWINDNSFSNLQIWHPVVGISTRESGSSNGIDGNRFTNIAIQADDVTTRGIDSLSGAYNSFVNLLCWDFGYKGAPEGTQRTVIFGPTSSSNTFTGGSVSTLLDHWGPIDYGSNNIILSTGGFITEIQQPLRIWRPNSTYINTLVVSHDGSNGTAASPAGPIAIKLSSNAVALGEADSTNYSARIVARNSATDDYGSFLYLQTHGTADNNTAGGYSNPVTIYPDGNIEFPRRIIQAQRSGSLTDGAPTQAEITGITFDSPSNAGAGYQVTILDTDGSGLLYRVESDGTTWSYTILGAHTGVFNVKDYGATGDGVTDDTDEIQAAADAAYAATNGKVVAPSGNYLISSAITIRSDADFTGATFNITGTTDTAVIFFDVGPQILKGKQVIFPRVIQGTAPTGGAWTGTSVGVAIVNSYNNTFYIPYTEDFVRGLLITSANPGATEYGSAHNIITFGDIRRSKIGLALSPADDKGYTNSNIITGGRITEYAGYENITGNHGIVLDSTDLFVDNNLLQNISMDGDSWENQIEVYGRNNTFQDLRLEPSDGVTYPPNVLWGGYDVTSDLDGGGNLWIGGYNSENIIFTMSAVSDNQHAIISPARTILHGDPPLTLQPNVALDDPALTIVRSDYNNYYDVDSVSKYAGIQLGYNYIRGKQNTQENWQWGITEYTGSHEWGPGSAVYDTKLSRTGVGELTVDNNLIALGTLNGKSRPTLDTRATISLTADSCLNDVRFNDNTSATDYTLPAAEVGLTITIMDIGGAVLTIDPVDGIDIIILPGTALGAGDSMDSPGAIGDYVVLMAIDDTRWVVIGQSGVWTDGGP